MKQNIVFILLMTILSAGCYQDKGNYDYGQLPEISVSGLEADKTYTAYVAEPFQIPVTVEITNGIAADLSYEWKLEGKVISTEKDLDVITNFPVRSNMYAQLDVIDNNTQVRHITLFKISVSSAFESGWMILSDLGDKSQLCFMRNDHVFVENIYHSQNNEYLSAGAYALCEHFLPWSTNTGQVFVACRQGSGYSVELDGNSLQKVIHTTQEFIGGAPEDFSPTSMNCVMGWDYLISAGKLYTREQPNGMNAQYQEGSFPNFPAAGDYELLPWTLKGHPVWSSDIIAFDKKTCSYALLREGEIKEFNISRDTMKAFHPSNMGKMLLGGGCYTMGSNYDRFLTFVRDINTGKIFVQRFYLSGWSNRAFYTTDETEFPEPSLIKEDTKFEVCSSGRKYVYFTSGKALYAYNYEDKVVSLLRNDFGGTIRDIALCITNNERLAIAVENAEDPAKSDFMILDVSVVGKGKTIEGTEIKGKCGRVVDILYKVGDQWSVPY